MKKLLSKHKTFSFKVNSATNLKITPNGIIVSDEVAKFVHGRLGDANVAVEEVDIEQAIKEITGSAESLT